MQNVINIVLFLHAFYSFSVIIYFETHVLRFFDITILWFISGSITNFRFVPEKQLDFSPQRAAFKMKLYVVLRFTYYNAFKSSSKKILFHYTY